MIWAIVLAAGESKRMGRPKMLLPFRSKTILETVIDTVLETSVDGMLVVLGAEAASLSPLLRAYPVKTVFNAAFRSGMLSSVQAGFSALPEAVTAALLVLGDQPAVSPIVIRELLSLHQSLPEAILIPVYRGRRGHPVLIPIGFRREISTLSPDIGLRELMRRHPEATHEVAVGKVEILQDIDDPEAYRLAVDGDHEQD